MRLRWMERMERERGGTEVRDGGTVVLVRRDLEVGRAT